MKLLRALSERQHKHGYVSDERLRELAKEKCVPCRLGSRHAVELLESVQAGTRPASDLQELPALGETLEQTSICGLGQVALNPILSLMKNIPSAPL